MANPVDLAPGAPVRAFIGLGANLGERGAALATAIEALSRLAGCRLLQRSRLYCSAPVEAAGPDFVNAVVSLTTMLSPHALLTALHGLEEAAGRVRGAPNAPRTLDLDLLLYGNSVNDIGAPLLPHPRLTQRAFVLRPLVEIAPELVLPDGRPLVGLLAAVSGQRIAVMGET